MSGHTMQSHFCDDMVDYCKLIEAVEYGIVDLQQIQEELDMQKRQEYIKNHPQKIWQGTTNGFWYTYIPDDIEGRRLIKKKSEKDLHDVIINYWKEQEENPTLKEVFQKWNDEKLSWKEIQSNTHERNECLFRTYFGEVENTRIKSVTPQWIECFIKEQIVKHEMSKKSFTALKSLTKSIFKKAKKEKYIDYYIRDVFEDMEISNKAFVKKVRDETKEVYTQEEVMKMAGYAKDYLGIRNLAVLLMFLTGVRIGELVAIKKEDVDELRIKICRTEVRTKKECGRGYNYDVRDFPKSEAGVRDYPVTKQVKQVLGMILAENPEGEYLFMEKGERIKTVMIRSQVKKICKAVGITYKSPHKVRKTHITILKDNHIGDKIVTSVAGHTDIECTNTYYHFDRTSLQEKCTVLSDIPEFQNLMPM